MHAKLTLCAANRRSAEEPEAFFMRSDRARDAITDHMKEMARDKVGITSYLKINGSGAHVELDVKGQYRDVCTALIAAVTKVHESVADEPPAPPRMSSAVCGVIDAPRGLAAAIMAEREKTVTETVED